MAFGWARKSDSNLSAGVLFALTAMPCAADLFSRNKPPIFLCLTTTAGVAIWITIATTAIQDRFTTRLGSRTVLQTPKGTAEPARATSIGFAFEPSAHAAGEAAFTAPLRLVRTISISSFCVIGLPNR